MAEHRLMRRVEEVADRLQHLRRLRSRARIWMLLSVGGLVLLGSNWLAATPLLSPMATMLLGGALLIVGGLWALRARADVHAAAVAVEDRFPDLDSRLLTAVGQTPNIDEGGFGYLQHEVISEALLHAQRRDWREAVPSRSMAGARLKQTTALLLAAAVFVGAAYAARRPFGNLTGRSLAGDALENPVDEYGLTVEPGDVQLERGTSLLVLARFARKLPSDVTLVASDADGARQQIPLSKSLEDPLFGGRVAAVMKDLRYRVRYDGLSSEEYRVTVFDYPELQQANATIKYPEYTGMDVKVIEDVRRVSVVEGSILTLACTLNKPVATARLFADDGTDYELAPVAHLPNVYSATWTPSQRQTLTLELTDDASRRNKQPPQFIVDVIPNRPPELNVAFPARDMRVSPLQELSLEANVWDDFGIKEYGLVYQLPTGDEQTVKLGGFAAADARVAVAHDMSFEAIQAQPNELVAYYFYADDVGPSGDVRRTMSNMYFAEVRHFDEIFRQLDSSGSGQGQGEGEGGGSPSAQLLQLQRDIVTATWNLIRRERGEPSAKLAEDAGVVADSQNEALELAAQLQESTEDALSRQYLEEAAEHMQQGESHLRTAAETPAVAPLSDAQTSTQGAYRALLKLQARERLVTQSQSQSRSASAGQQQFRQQLDQLELKSNRNRYETEQQAAPSADRESLQVLNRLRELARRQEDLNEKIQELENELRTAKTEEQRDEIERQLKRLQEEQQQLLRDLDEMNERMEQPENRSRMAEARQQVEQTREHLRQTKEALQAGQVSKALAEGTRAQRELEDLKQQFRDQTAGQFADAMRELRDDVRELAQQEQELGDRLAGEKRAEEPSSSRNARPSLRDETPQGKSPQDAVAEQQENLSNVMRDAEDIVRQSEVNEPLLSKKLYDAVRSTRVDQPEESLAMTSQFLKLGLNREAALAEQQARRGIDKLREGVDEAAESVLGNEAASLERARKEVDELARAIASEMAQADPKFADELKQPADQAQRDSQASEGQPSDPSQNGKPSENRDGGQPGNQQSPASQQSGQNSEQNPDRPSQTPSDQQGQQPGEGKSDQPPGSNPGESNQGQSSQPNPGQQANGQGSEPGGQPSSGQQANGQGSQSGEQAQSGRGQGDSDRDNPLSAFLQRGGNVGRGNSGPHLGPQGPLTSSEFVQWSDRMRDVEEMLDDPDLRAEVARIRDQAREVRIDVKRHSKQPDWDLVRLQIYGPMLELQDRLAEELARLEPDSEEIVPLDRDPVPDRYAELVRRYYERLGSGR